MFTFHVPSQKTAFEDHKSFQEHGSLSAMGKALGRGMVLVLSIWDDHTVNMLWVLCALIIASEY